MAQQLEHRALRFIRDFLVENQSKIPEVKILPIRNEGHTFVVELPNNHQLYVERLDIINPQQKMHEIWADVTLACDFQDCISISADYTPGKTNLGEEAILAEIIRMIPIAKTGIRDMIFDRPFQPGLGQEIRSHFT